MSQPLVGMDLAELCEALGPGQPGYRARQLYEAIYRGQTSGLARVSTFPAGLRQALAERYSMGLPEIAQRYESADGTLRYLLRLEPGGLRGGLQVLHDGAAGPRTQPDGRRDRRAGAGGGAGTAGSAAQHRHHGPRRAAAQPRERHQGHAPSARS